MNFQCNSFFEKIKKRFKEGLLLLLKGKHAEEEEPKGSFTLAAAVCGFRSGLRQRRDRNFSISAEQRNRLPQMHAENAVM